MQSAHTDAEREVLHVRCGRHDSAPSSNTGVHCGGYGYSRVGSIGRILRDDESCFGVGWVVTGEQGEHLRGQEAGLLRVPVVVDVAGDLGQGPGYSAIVCCGAGRET